MKKKFVSLITLAFGFLLALMTSAQGAIASLIAQKRKDEGLTVALSNDIRDVGVMATQGAAVVPDIAPGSSLFNRTKSSVMTAITGVKRKATLTIAELKDMSPHKLAATCS